MLGRVFDFLDRVGQMIRRTIWRFVGLIFWPFKAVSNWIRGRGWLIKIPVFAILAAVLAGYVYLLFVTQFWSAGSPDYALAYSTENRPAAAGDRLPDGTCEPSAVVDLTADLIDQNVNQSVWVPSNPLHKAGLLFIWDWKDTPFLDNRAAFQLGVNQAIRRTAIELVDRLGRVRGTSSINQNLQDAREAANYRETAWIFTLSPPFLQPSTPARLRDARKSLLAFNQELAACDAQFDMRADNLLQFIDRVTADIGSTSDVLQRQIQNANFIGFDPKADDRFWFTYGQLYGYYGILMAMRSDFRRVYDLRNLEGVWQRIDEQFRDALDVKPPIVANGSASSLIKSHLETIGFDLLRIRANLVEMRDVLDR